MFNYQDDVLSVVCSPLYIESAQERFPELPRVTDRQKAALELLLEVANDPKVYLAMDFRSGDIQLINNFTTMHARTAFEDWPDAATKRHLLRIWLCVPDGLPLPQCFAERYGTVEIGRRGGITGPDTILSIPPGPTPPPNSGA